MNDFRNMKPSKNNVFSISLLCIVSYGLWGLVFRIGSKTVLTS